MRCIALFVSCLLLSGCTVIKTVDKPWPVMPKPDRPSLNVNKMDFRETPPTVREFELLQDIYNTAAYAEALEAGIAVYNSKAAENNSKVLEQMGKIAKVQPHEKVQPKEQPAHMLDGPSEPELDDKEVTVPSLRPNDVGF